jgi:hypothetical protein
MDRINNNDFLIARDYDYHFIYLVSDKFKELVEKNNFNIKLKNA